MSRKILIVLGLFSTGVLLLVIIFFIYLRFFWSLTDKNLSEKESYGYLSNVYQNNKNKFSCVSNIPKDGHGLRYLRLEKSGLLSRDKIRINDDLVILPSLKKYKELIAERYMIREEKKTSKYRTIDTLLEEFSIDSTVYSCLIEILSTVEPFFVVELNPEKISFWGDGAFETGYGIMYYFDSKNGKEIDRQYESGMTGILRSKRIEDNWYTFVSR